MLTDSPAKPTEPRCRPERCTRRPPSAGAAWRYARPSVAALGSPGRSQRRRGGWLLCTPWAAVCGSLFTVSAERCVRAEKRCCCVKHPLRMGSAPRACTVGRRCGGVAELWRRRPWVRFNFGRAFSGKRSGGLAELILMSNRGSMHEVRT